MPQAEPFNPPQLVDPQGRPARKPEDKACPSCGADPDRRLRSSGFGAWHDCCGQCGHDFHGEQTAP